MTLGRPYYYYYYYRSCSLVLCLFLLVAASPARGGNGRGGGSAFAVVRPATGRSASGAALKLSSSSSSDRVKRVGGGLPTVQPGDRRLFDPAAEGKLGGTDSLDRRLAAGASYHRQPQAAAAAAAPTAASAVAATTTAPPLPDGVELRDAQHWLEDLGVPTNFARPSAPVTATVLGRGRLIDESAPGDIQHIVLQLPEGFHYVEGQSLSVIPPGTDDPATGRPHRPRLYSIASTRYGDALDGRTVSLCVRRAEFVDPVTGLADPSRRGVCSNFLCDAVPGRTQVMVAGPVGKTMLLPEDPSRDVVMVATGTGVAPFRGFLHRLFVENTVARHMFTGRAWLVLGVPVTGGLLYQEEFRAMLANAADGGGGRLEVTYAISREMTNAAGGKYYVQDALAERADELFARLDAGAAIYFCGLRGMMPGILEALERAAAGKGIDWAAMLKRLQANHQWHVEVY